MAGLADAVDKAKPDSESSSDAAVEDKFLGEAFGAAKRGDGPAFKRAMLGAIKACVRREMDGEY